MSGLICKGNVQIGLLDNNDMITGYMGIKNTTQLAIQPGAPTKKERISKLVANYGTALDQVLLPTPSSLKISIDEFDSDVVGMAFMGTVSALSVTGGSVTAEAHSAALGLWVPLGHQFITVAGFAVKKGATTYVLGTDYIVDYNAGLLYIKKGGTIVAGDALTVDYAYASKTGTKVDANTQTQLTVAVYMYGVNLLNNKPIEVRIPKAVIAPSSPIDFLSDNFVVTQLDGSPIAIGSNAPYTYTEYDS